MEEKLCQLFAYSLSCLKTLSRGGKWDLRKVCQCLKVLWPHYPEGAPSGDVTGFSSFFLVLLFWELVKSYLKFLASGSFLLHTRFSWRNLEKELRVTDCTLFQLLLPFIAHLVWTLSSCSKMLLKQRKEPGAWPGPVVPLIHPETSQAIFIFLVVVITVLIQER